jgi:ubiquinone/menaquinone biosynthesis C-methylase UbiE
MRTVVDQYAYRMELARQYFPTTGRLIDVGCGSGEWGERLSKALGLEGYGIDVLDGCTAKIEFRVYDGHRIPFHDAYFDALIAIHVLHHTEAPETLVSEISRVTRPGARLMIIEDMASSKVQNFLTMAKDWYGNKVGNLLKATRGKRDWSLLRVPMTYNYRTYPQWYAMFENAGFRILEMRSLPKPLIEHGVFILERKGTQGEPPRA